MVFKIFLLYWALSSVYCAFEVKNHLPWAYKEYDIVSPEIIRVAVFIATILLSPIFAPIFLYTKFIHQAKRKYYKIKWTIKYNWMPTILRFLYRLGIVKKNPEHDVLRFIATMILDIIIDMNKIYKIDLDDDTTQ